jgi:hypothetical protein
LSYPDGEPGGEEQNRFDTAAYEFQNGGKTLKERKKFFMNRDPFNVK